MKNKVLNILSYAFFASLIIFFILNSSSSPQPWVKPVKLFCIGICIFVALVYLGVFVYCAIDNKKIDKMLDKDDYDNLIDYANNKLKSKIQIFPERKTYYQYILVLSYMAKQDDENIEIAFSNFTGNDMFPISYYWKACQEFAQGRTENIESYYSSFINNASIRQKAFKLINIIHLFETVHLYTIGNIKEAKEKIENLNTSDISMPYTLQTIEIIKNTIVKEEIQEDVIDIIEENKNEE